MAWTVDWVIIYCLFYLFAARVLRDFGELLTTTIYNSTPLFVINSFNDHNYYLCHP